MKKRTPWQRLALSLAGISVIEATWRLAVRHLYTLKPEAFAAFTALTVHSQYVIGAIVVFMVTGRLVYEWKMETASSIAEEGKQILAERTPAPKHYDDPAIP
ncbi:MAG: hypothetical protein WCH57_05480 [Verrucomicrobiota bacterium]